MAFFNVNTIGNSKDFHFDGDYDSLVNKPTIPTKTSQLTNDSNFINDVSDKANIVHNHHSQDISDFETSVVNLINMEAGRTLSTLDNNGMIPISQLPPEVKEVRVVNSITERDALEIFQGLFCYVLDATLDEQIASGGASYINTGEEWKFVSNLDSFNAVLDWNNITNKPTSTSEDIDGSVDNSHVHPNKLLLDTYTVTNEDIQESVTNTHNHTNKDSLNKLSVDVDNVLEVDGIKTIDDDNIDVKSTYSSNKINSLINNTNKELYKIKSTSTDDSPSYLNGKIDNITVSLVNNKLVVKSIDGLEIGVANINTWLSGTSGNLQNQLDKLNNSINAVSSGMAYLGKIETYSDLMNVNNKVNGSLVVVLSDESLSYGRSMYVYSETLGKWDFIGEFSFSDTFIDMTDTPNDYINSDGKVLKVDETNNKIIFSDIDYSEIKNAPSSAVFQIDETVSKSHEHSNLVLLETYNQTNANIMNAINQSHTHTNKANLDKVNMDVNGDLLFNGKLYKPHTQREYLYVSRAGTLAHGVGMTLRFNNKINGNIPITADGAFTLQKGKVYSVEVNVLLDMLSWVKMAMIETSTGAVPAECPNGAILWSISGTNAESPNGILSLIIEPTSTRNFGIRFLSRGGTGNINLRGGYSFLKIMEI